MVRTDESDAHLHFSSTSLWFHVQQSVIRQETGLVGPSTLQQNTSISRVFVLGAPVRAMLLGNMVGSAPVRMGNPTTEVKEHFRFVTFTLAFICWTPFRHSCSPGSSNVVSAKGSHSFFCENLGNVLLHVEMSCGGSWWSNSGCCGGNHNESAGELVQDSEPKIAQEIHQGVCRELASGARQRQKPQQNFGQSDHGQPDSTVGKQQMCTCRARKRCQNLTSRMKHGEATIWITTAQS